MLKQGTQIIYVPNHAEDVGHPDCEYGFVCLDDGSDAVWCRYFNKDWSLRTMANSEKTLRRNLVLRKYTTEETIEHVLTALRGNFMWIRIPNPELL